LGIRRFINVRLEQNRELTNRAGGNKKREEKERKIPEKWDNPDLSGLLMWSTLSSG